jgi:hydrogenase nickel incorporation protein HypB
VTEGEDKPLKYPIMFQEADCVLITKIDLVPYLNVEVEKFIAHIRQMNTKATIIPVSAQTGENLDVWYSWISSACDR